MDSLLCCPLDGQPLVLQNNQWCCPQGHSFDVARQGYVHLLPVQEKRSLDPGDSKEMVAARRAFLDAGFYQPLAQKITEMVVPCLSTGSRLLDAGCGEGYYLDFVAKHTGFDLVCVGNDISKHAIIKACQRNRSPLWLVASNRKLPLQPASMDMVMCLFGFPVYAEFLRLLRQDGCLLMVDPAENHLAELRQIIYPEVKLKQDKLVDAATQVGFCLVDDQQLTYVIDSLSQEQLYALLLMTPHFFKITEDRRQQALQSQNLSLTVDVRFRLFRK